MHEAEAPIHRLQPLAVEYIRSTVACPSSSAFHTLALTGTQDWRSEIGNATEAVMEGGSLVLLLPNPTLARRVVALMSPSRARPLGPSVRRVRRHLASMNFTVETTHSIWPTPKAARIVLPRKHAMVARYVHRAGLIGGGGQRLWLRTAVRSLAPKWLVEWLTPVVAVFVHKRNEG